MRNNDRAVFEGDWKMKKVLIYAYMAGNLGDDLMVLVLCQRYPNVNFRLWADKSYKKRFQHIRNLKVYSPDDKKVLFWNRFCNKMKRIDKDIFGMLVRNSDATVHVGGSVYIQHENYEATYNLDNMLRSASKRMYVCGANFGPYEDEEYYRRYYDLLKRYDGVCFRDQYSYQLFKELPNVRYAPDIVFNYKTPESNKCSEKRQVLFSVIRLDDRKGKFAISQYAENYRRFMVKLAETYIQKGYKVKFVSFCKMQGDEQAILQITEAISPDKKEEVDVYFYRDNLAECLELFDESEVVVGTRFHSIILGWLKGKKVLPIVYDKKTLHVLEDNKCRNYVELGQLDHIDTDSLPDKAERLPEEQREYLIRAAEGQFEKLNELLEDR